MGGDGDRIGRDREGGKGGGGGGGRNVAMANTQTDVFIKTVTANRAQLAKAGLYKKVGFCERRGERGIQTGRRNESYWLSSEEGVGK